MTVRELPPRESCKILVNFESLYATCFYFFDSSVSCEMTFPRAKRPILIATPSLKVSPDAPVFFGRSLPARSTKWNLATIYSSGFAAPPEFP